MFFPDISRRPRSCLTAISAYSSFSSSTVFPPGQYGLKFSPAFFFSPVSDKKKAFAFKIKQITARLLPCGRKVRSPPAHDVSQSSARLWHRAQKYISSHQACLAIPQGKSGLTCSTLDFNVSLPERASLYPASCQFYHGFFLFASRIWRSFVHRHTIKLLPGSRAHVASLRLTWQPSLWLLS